MVQIWTDASYDKGIGGLACLVRYRNQKTGKMCEVKGTVSEPCKNNNIAELKAVLLGIKTAHVVPCREDMRWNIVTDSNYAIKSILYADCLDERNERGKIAHEIIELLEGKKWRVYHKKGHGTDKSRYTQIHNRVDALAYSSRSRT